MEEVNNTISKLQLLNARFMRSALKSWQLEDLKKIKDNLSAYIDERIEELQEQSRLAAQRDNIFRQAAEMVLSEHLDLAEFQSYIAMKTGIKAHSAPHIGAKGVKIPPKYKYTSLSGEEMYWSGRGAIPKEFREMLEKTGKSKEEFLL